MYKQLLLASLIFLTIDANGQEKPIQLYKGTAPGSEGWTYNEKEATTPFLVAYDVSHPTLTAYLPDPAIATGTAVIVCPGGGFYILSMKDEGISAAQWLNQRGITAFILKYRLAQSMTDNPIQELFMNMSKSDFSDKIKPAIPFAVADGKEAIKYVRAHAAEFGISPTRIGIIGFSAGGAVAASTALNYNAENRPDFVGVIYGFLPAEFDGPVPADAPPLFLTVASDDPLNLAPRSVELYSKWLASKHKVELHIYQKGSHGFGLKKQNIPTDSWIDRYGDWMGLNGLLTPAKGK
jgi:acetyl esterase/lipase